MDLCKTIGTCKVMKCLGFTICMVGIYAVSAYRAEAVPILNPSNNNYYEFIQVDNPFVGNNNSWATASAAASASVFNGTNGYLATITSQAENDFIFGLISPGSFSGFNGAWLGGKSPEGWLVGPEAGQSFSYTNWGGSEPNNAGFAYMNIGWSFAGIDPGQWADDSGVQGVPSGSDPVIGYFVEYEETTPVPEPATIVLFGIGLAGLACGAVRRRFKRVRK